MTSLGREPGPAELALNDIGRVRLRTSKPLAFDPYARNRFTGSFILIDEATNDTVGAGMITAPDGARGSVAPCAARRWCWWRLPSPAAAAGRRPRSASPRPRRAPPRRRRPTRARRPARGDLSLRVLPRTPPVIVHVPDGLRAGQRAPLVLGLHGAGQDARGFEAESNLSNVADEHHFVVAYPMSWRARGLLALPRARQPAQRRCACCAPRSTRCGRTACVDRGPRARDRHLLGRADDLRRRLRARRPDPRDRARSRAARATCRPAIPARPISVLDIHGTSDQIVSYRGRGADHDGRVRDVMADWAGARAAARAPRTRRIDPDVTRLDWPACRGGVRVAHLRIDGGRHAWPPLGGPPGIGIDGAEEIWRFFAALPARSLT